MVILWKGQPAHNDTHLVSAVWFDAKARTTLYYTIEGSTYVHRARTAEVDAILTPQLAAQRRANEAHS